MPLHAWDLTTFAKNGGCLGKSVEISKETLEKTFLEFGRVWAQVQSHRSIDKDKEIRIFGNFFLVYVKEEQILYLIDGRGEGF